MDLSLDRASLVSTKLSLELQLITSGSCEEGVVSKLEKQVKTLQQENAGLTEKLTFLEDQSADLLEEKRNDFVKKRRSEVFEIEKEQEMVKLQKQNESLSEKLEKLQSNCDQLVSKKRKLETSLHTVEEKAGRMGLEIEDGEVVDTRKRAEIQQELERKSAYLEKVQRTCQQLQKRIQLAESEKLEATNRAEDLELQLGQLQEEMNVTKAPLEAVEELKEDLQNFTERYNARKTAFQDLQADRDQLAWDHTVLEREREKLKSKVSSLLEEIDELKSEISSLKNAELEQEKSSENLKLKQLEEENEGLKNKMKVLPNLARQIRDFKDEHAILKQQFMGFTAVAKNPSQQIILETCLKNFI